MTATAGKRHLKLTPAQSWLFSITPSCSHSILLAKYDTNGWDLWFCAQVVIKTVNEVISRCFAEDGTTIAEVFSLQITFFLPLRSSLLKLANISTLAYSELQRELLLKMWLGVSAITSRLFEKLVGMQNMYSTQYPGIKLFGMTEPHGDYKEKV